MKKLIVYFLVIVMIFPVLISGCGGKKADPLAGVETKQVTDDYGRNVTVPAEITKIAASGATAQMLLMTIAPDMLVGLASSPSKAERAYYPEDMWYLPTFGQFYGSKSTLNIEALMTAEPQIIIDTGDYKISGVNDMNGIQKQTGIPTVFFEADLQHMPEAFRQLGALLGREEKAEELAQFVEKTMAMAEEKRLQIPAEERVSILYGTGTSGLDVNANGSSQAQVIDIIGAKNAIIPDVVTDKGGGTEIDMEKVFVQDPDVILFTPGGPFEKLETSEWADLKAVRSGRTYEIPSIPYNWISSPPSVNMVIGVWWLGQLVYPKYYNDYDIIEVAQEFYDKFWHYDLSEEEARSLLSRSIYKD